MKRLARLIVIGISVWAAPTEAMAGSLIAEFPSSEFKTSLEASEAAFERCRDSNCVGRTVLLSGQSYEADGEQYVMYDATYRDGTFKFKRSVPNGELIARAVGIASERVVVDDHAGSVTIRSASPHELARFLDYVYRVVFEIRPLPGGQNYNFVAEFE
jgi:hypothetical protein